MTSAQPTGSINRLDVRLGPIRQRLLRCRHCVVTSLRLLLGAPKLGLPDAGITPPDADITPLDVTAEVAEDAAFAALKAAKAAKREEEEVTTHE